MKTAARLQQVPDYPFARWGSIVEEVRRTTGREIIRLDIGSPDLPPSPAVIAALNDAARQDHVHGYSSYRGLPALREAFAGYYAQRFGVELDPQTQVTPLIGSKEGIVNLALALLDPGDLVLVPNPGYAPYTAGAILAGAETYPLPLLAENAFLPNLDALPSTVVERAKLLWLNYPNNPTGATADLAFFEKALAFARRHNILVCHDAPYCDVSYDGYQAPSILQVPGAEDVAVEFNSLSKTFNMAGWRMGVAVGNAEAQGALARLKSNIDSGFFYPVQMAAIEALTGERSWINERNARYQARRDCVLEALTGSGLQITPPRAALYIWAQLPAGWGAEAFARALLERQGVSVAPGTFFGSAGEGYIRIALTAEERAIQTAVQRIREFL